MQFIGPTNPQNQKDSVALCAPHDPPRLLWDLIEDYFINKYNIKLSQTTPRETVTQPVITWRILRRTPGGNADQRVQRAGESFTGYTTGQSNADGTIVEIHTQRQIVLYEYMVYATSSSEADDIVWDLEQSLRLAVSRLSEIIPGIQWKFEEQVADGGLLWRQQDELLHRTIRFRCDLPIRYPVLKGTIRSIEILSAFGRYSRRTTFTRLDSPEFWIPVETNEIVTGIGLITISGSGTTHLERFTLRKHIDYEVKLSEQPATRRVAYIEWNDTSGRTPQVGEEFEVTYELYEKLGFQSITKTEGTW